MYLCCTFQVDSPYCPNCLENMPSAEAKLKRNRYRDDIDLNCNIINACHELLSFNFILLVCSLNILKQFYTTQVMKATKMVTLNNLLYGDEHSTFEQNKNIFLCVQ